MSHSYENWEVTIILPLGVVANQLRRIEEQLRLLNMKALEVGKECENEPHRRRIEIKLDHISELLGSISTLVSDIGADIQPGAANVIRMSSPDQDD